MQLLKLSSDPRYKNRRTEGFEKRVRAGSREGHAVLENCRSVVATARLKESLKLQHATFTLRSSEQIGES